VPLGADKNYSTVHLKVFDLERVTKPSQDSQATLKPGATRLVGSVNTATFFIPQWIG